MARIVLVPLPDNALLARYLPGNRASADSGYTDCYVTTAPGDICLEDYVVAFYTTWLFKLERFILRWVGRPSTDEEAIELACGNRRKFAAWFVEDRAENQILLCDFRERTRSWLMTGRSDCGDHTTLYFGSAVIHSENAQGAPRISLVFRLLLGFHRLYAQSLLALAARKLR